MTQTKGNTTPTIRVVGVADRIISNVPGEVLVTHALGSCLGIAVYDPKLALGGILHVMMPTSSINPERARKNPFVFVDTGVPAFFRDLYAAGAGRGRLVIKVVGGAMVAKSGNNRFDIGKRNLVVLKKMFWKNDLLVFLRPDCVGGTIPRTLHLEIGTGHAWITTNGRKTEL
jgi:chemotaxis protein CheD